MISFLDGLRSPIVARIFYRRDTNTLFVTHTRVMKTIKTNKHKYDSIINAFLTLMRCVLVTFQSSILLFIDQRFERITSTPRALQLMRRFETLDLPNLGVAEKYQRILMHYSRDIDMVAKIYQKNKTEPVVARDLPPVAGRYSGRQLPSKQFTVPSETTFKIL